MGTGLVVRGHTDDFPEGRLAVGNITNAYDSTGNNGNQDQGSGWEQRRAFDLSNGSVVWDFAGNVTEWVDWDTDDDEFTLGPRVRLPINSYFSLTELYGLDATDLGPSDSDLLSGNHSLGMWRGGGTQSAATRGGHSSHRGAAGIFHLSLDNAATDASTNMGFRCVYRP